MIGGVPQTRVAWTQQVDMGEVIPKPVVNIIIVTALIYLSAMRKLFDKGLEIDGATRARNVGLIMGHNGVGYSEEENRILTEGGKHFADFQEMKAEVQEFFLAQRGVDEWDAYDARAVGEAMCIKTEAE